MVDTINTVEDIKRFYKNDIFAVSGDINCDPYSMYGSSTLPDTINFGAAQPVNIPSSFGKDVITFS
jgi:hypothetical protein